MIQRSLPLVGFTAPLIIYDHLIFFFVPLPAHSFLIKLFDHSFPFSFSIQILPAAASRFVHASKKFITLQRGLAKRTHWDITIHNDVPSVADPWFHLLDEKKLIPGDEVVFYYRFDDHAWELLDKKDIEWENDDINFEEM